MNYTADFATWQDALPFALGIAHAKARRQPFTLDVESLVMEALWRAQVGGAVLSRVYVRQRIAGAVTDEMRRNAEGGRRNYQGVGSFVDIDDQWSLADEGVRDVLEDIDRRRTLERLPGAARYLVRELVVVGRTQDAMADDFGVSQPAMCQVIAQLKANPSSVVRLPGALDLHGQLRAAAGRYLTGVTRDGPSSRVLAAKLGTARTTAWRWAGADRPLPKGIVAGKGGPLQAHLHEVGLDLVEQAFARSKGSIEGAATILGCSPMTARRWRLQLPEGAVDRRGGSRARADLSTTTILELRGQGITLSEIGKRLRCAASTVWCRLRGAAEVPGNPDAP